MFEGEKPDEFITAAEATKILGYCKTHFYTLIRSGAIVGAKLGGSSIRALRSSVEEYATRKEDVMSAQEIADVLKLPVRVARRVIRQDMRFIRIRNARLVPRVEFERWLKETFRRGTSHAQGAAEVAEAAK